MRLAAHVTVTRLPYGGVVLADASTLTVAEFDERVLDRVLSGTHPDLRAVITQLTAVGWLEEA